MNSLTAEQMRELILAAALFVASFSVSIIVITFILVRLPPMYFHESHSRDFLSGRHTSIRWIGIAIKNLVGVLLVLLGILMSIPGVPGQGMLTILLGIVLLDLPGKRRVERALIGRPSVLAKINRLRLRFGRPPLVLE